MKGLHANNVMGLSQGRGASFELQCVSHYTAHISHMVAVQKFAVLLDQVIQLKKRNV